MELGVRYDTRNSEFCRSLRKIIWSRNGNSFPASSERVLTKIHWLQGLTSLV